jgi:allene oxide cyclase-like protein
MKRLAAVAAAAALLAAIVAAGAGGQAPTGRTLVLTELAKGGTFGFVDNPPKSKRTRSGEPRRISVGDMFVFSSRIADQQGTRVGKLHVQCVVTVPGALRSAESVCTGVFRLTDGLISVVTAIVGEPTTVSAVVTGGTGTYAGARGTLTSVSHKNGSSTDTLQLLP